MRTWRQWSAAWPTRCSFWRSSRSVTRSCGCYLRLSGRKEKPCGRRLREPSPPCQVTWSTTCFHSHNCRATHHLLYILLQRCRGVCLHAVTSQGPAAHLAAIRSHTHTWKSFSLFNIPRVQIMLWDFTLLFNILKVTNIVKNIYWITFLQLH